MELPFQQMKYMIKFPTDKFYKEYIIPEGTKL